MGYLLLSLTIKGALKHHTYGDFKQHIYVFGIFNFFDTLSKGQRCQIQQVVYNLSWFRKKVSLVEPIWKSYPMIGSVSRAKLMLGVHDVHVNSFIVDGGSLVKTSALQKWGHIHFNKPHQISSRFLMLFLKCNHLNYINFKS